MSCTNRESCLFRQFQNSPDSLPESMVGALSILSSMETEPTAIETVTEAIDALEAPACSVDDCGASIKSLFRYVTSAGADAPRQELDEVVAPSCVILDIPHDSDAKFESYPDFPW